MSLLPLACIDPRLVHLAFGFELDVVNDREAFCVVKDQYSEYGEVLRDSVAHWERRGQQFFLMKDDLAVTEAVDRGAERLGDTEYVLRL